MSLAEQLLRHEGLRLKPYRDSVGKLTIGVGRNLDDVGISESEAMLLLEHDIARAEGAVTARLPWVGMLDQTRKNVLVNMAFNMGINNLLLFQRFLSATAMGDWELAAKEMLDSLWAKQVGKRAIELAEIMRSGEVK